MKYAIDHFGIEPVRAIARKLEARERARALEAGLEVEGIVLAAEPADLEAFTALLVLLREEEAAISDPQERSKFLSGPQTIVDIQGEPHELKDVPTLRALLVAYGKRVRRQWAESVARRVEIAKAATTGDLEKILWPAPPVPGTVDAIDDGARPPDAGPNADPEPPAEPPEDPDPEPLPDPPALPDKPF